MRVSGNHKDIQQACALYNKGIGAGFCADNFLKEYGKKATSFLNGCGKKALDFLKECRKRAAASLTNTASALEEAGKGTIVFLKNTTAFLKNTAAFLKKMQEFLKINEKKMVNYLAVPNNLCTLSLSLSLIYLA